MHIYLWQRIISPHMSGLISALASNKGWTIVYVAEQKMSFDRAQQGWVLPSLGNAKIEFAPTDNKAINIAKNAPNDSIHICQGIRANGMVGAAQKTLSRRNLTQWIILETVDDSGIDGFIKRSLYRWLFWFRRNQFQGILAIGWETTDWIITRGVSKNKVFPFTYFLPDLINFKPEIKKSRKLFQFIFVGRLVRLKCVNLLIHALANLSNYDFELIIIGDGPCKESLEKEANYLLPKKVKWLGKISMTDVQKKMAQADCLVLPSRYDGWGAVISEALMVGAPAVCSSTCGSSDVVRASGVGGVFPVGNIKALTVILEDALKAKSQSFDDRLELANWAKCLGGESGSSYLLDIFSCIDGKNVRPLPPWSNDL